MNTGIDISCILFYKEDRGWLTEARDSYYIQQFTGTSELIEIHSPGTTSQNVNAGIAKAKGDYIKLLCDDDRLTPRCFQSLYDKAQEGYDLVCGAAINYDVEKSTGRIFYSGIPSTIHHLANENTIHGGTVLFRRESLLRVGGFNEELNYGEEYDVYLKMAVAGMRFGVVDDLVYFYRIHNRMKSMQARVDDGGIYLKRKREILHTIQEHHFGNFTKIKK